VINVWATWCVPCVAEMPDLRAMAGSFGADVALAGVSLDDMIPAPIAGKWRPFSTGRKSPSQRLLHRQP